MRTTKLISLFLCFLLLSCSKNEPDLLNDASFDNKEDFLIDEETAYAGAVAMLNQMDFDKTMVKGTKRITKRSVASKKLIKAKNDDVPAYYVFNFKNDAGFAIASADKRDSVAVFAASQSGNINLNDWENGRGDVGLLKSLIENYHKYVISGDINNSRSATSLKSKPRKDPWANYVEYESLDTVIKKGPIIGRWWGQVKPFNPNNDNHSCYGCVPVALGLVMSYYQHPESINYNNSSYTFDWDLINLVTDLNTAKTYKNGNQEPLWALSDLLLTIGDVGKAKYTPSITTMANSNIGKVLSTFGYSYSYSSVSDKNVSSIGNEILYNHPVIMAGKQAEKEIGHAWVVDGLIRTRLINGWINPETGEMMENTYALENCYTEYNNYFLINWGWANNPIHNSDHSSDSYYFEHEADLWTPYVSVNSAVFNVSEYSYDTSLAMWYMIRPIK